MCSKEERGIGVASAGALWRACRRLLACMLVAAPAAGEDGVPVVSPDRIEDVTYIAADADAFPKLDDFAWRAFIALNWPSRTDAAHRGVPDRAKTIGDSGPRVWETFKARYELFQVGSAGRPIAPQP